MADEQEEKPKPRRRRNWGPQRVTGPYGDWMREQDRRDAYRRRYQENREKILEYNREWKRKNGYKRPYKPRKPPTRAELRRREEKRLKRLQSAAERRQEWNELGRIVVKMNLEAGLSQEAIYKLLGGLASKKKISEWCLKGKKLHKLKPSQNSHAKRTSKPRGRRNQGPG